MKNELRNIVATKIAPNKNKELLIKRELCKLNFIQEYDTPNKFIFIVQL